MHTLSVVTSSAPARASAVARAPAYLASVGDPNDPVTWSGTPYHFLHWARFAGLLDEGLPLSTTEPIWMVRRWAWNGLQALGGDRLGGYQYSSSFLERLWQPQLAQLRGALVINCFQLFAPSIAGDARIEKWFFIDQTLLQLFDHYRLRRTIGHRVAREALARERDGYHAAAGIVTHSQWAADSVRDHYGVPLERIHVAVPGANIERAPYERWESRAQPASTGGPLRLVFIGKDWYRKGLDRLLEALSVARARGFRGSLRIIGCDRQSLNTSNIGTGPPLVTTVGITPFHFSTARPEPQFAASPATGLLLVLSGAPIPWLPLRPE